MCAWLWVSPVRCILILDSLDMYAMLAYDAYRRKSTLLPRHRIQRLGSGAQAANARARRATPARPMSMEPYQTGRIRVRAATAPRAIAT